MHVKGRNKSDTGQGMDGFYSTILGTSRMPVKEIVKAAREDGGTLAIYY